MVVCHTIFDVCHMSCPSFERGLDETECTLLLRQVFQICNRYYDYVIMSIARRWRPFDSERSLIDKHEVLPLGHDGAHYVECRLDHLSDLEAILIEGHYYFVGVHKKQPLALVKQTVARFLRAHTLEEGCANLVPDSLLQRVNLYKSDLRSVRQLSEHQDRGLIFVAVVNDVAELL